jgi:hypothetical protein
MVRNERVMQLNKCCIGRRLVSFYAQPNKSFDRSANSAAFIENLDDFKVVSAPG